MLSISLSLNMNHLTLKQKTRQEKKKKKMAALIEIARLNDKDRDSKFIVETQNPQFESTDLSTEQPLCKKKRPNSEELSTEALLKVINFQHSTNECETEENAEIEDNYSKLKLEYRNRKLKSKSNIKFRLKSVGEKASLIVQYDKRIPLFMTDLQQLILFSMMGRHTYLPSRWCQLEKYSDVSHTVVLAIEGISLYHFTSYESVLKGMSVQFENKIEVVTPGNNSLIKELALLPYICSQKDNLITEHGSLEAVFQNVIDNMTMVRAIFPISKTGFNLDNKNIPETDKFSRKLLLMSVWQMVEENYPLPLKGELCKRYKNYILTKDSYSEITSSSPMFGLDCEMCRTQSGLSELTRITIVNEKHEIIYDKLVKPYSAITDYLTKYSGITEEMLINVSTRLENVQEDLKSILPDDAILIGHSLNFDLKALKMMHPYCIDTSVIFNITGDRMRKSKLRTIAKKFLGELIQQDSNGHSSAEDSLTSLKLAQLKLQKSLDFGDSVLYGLKRSETNYARYFNKSINDNEEEKKTIIIGSKEVVLDYNQYFNEVKSQNVKYEVCTTHKEMIEHLCNTCTQYKLSLAHLQVPVHDVQYPVVEKTLGALDQWIIDIWTHMAVNGLCVIIFNGQSQGSGLCFLGIKK